MAEFSRFDAADYLNDEETVAESITAALEDPNPDVFLTAVRDVARARGMARLFIGADACRRRTIQAFSTPGSQASTGFFGKL